LATAPLPKILPYEDYIPIQLAWPESRAFPPIVLPGGVRRARDCFGGAAAGRLGPPSDRLRSPGESSRGAEAQSDPRTAVGRYLDAADASVRSVGLSSGSEVTEEARSIYNAASQEVALLLRPLFCATALAGAAWGCRRYCGPGCVVAHHPPFQQPRLAAPGGRNTLCTFLFCAPSIFYQLLGINAYLPHLREL